MTEIANCLFPGMYETDPLRKICLVARSICLTLLAVQASRVSCTTECSAQPLLPKARCKVGSLRSRVSISDKPCAPARMVIKASINFCTGEYLTVF